LIVESLVILECGLLIGMLEAARSIVNQQSSITNKSTITNQEIKD